MNGRLKIAPGATLPLIVAIRIRHRPKFMFWYR